MENNGTWTKSERSLYLIACGIVASAIAVFAISQFIEACRSRPKVEMIVLGVPKGKGKEKEVKQPAVKENNEPLMSQE